ncbi:MAG TPA: Ppx/GppA phosphatase family protein [Myxococcales bacterium]|nr:Ppx/GppA phosphatase family protein [Myxococcales bacterium]
MTRYAAIDVGTNSVLLLVAEKRDGRFAAVAERAEITRLGRGVDRTRTLSPEGMEATLRCLEAFAAEARALGAGELVVTATSAARDAANGQHFLEAARARAGVAVEIISGDEEAELSFAAARADFGALEPGRPLVVLDIGGGSTEFVYGVTEVSYRRSFDAGSVRLTERFVTAHPIPPQEREAIRRHLRDAFAPLPPPPAGARLVGIAGTVTTLYAVEHRVEPYDAARVHGQPLSRAELAALVERLCGASLEERRRMPGLQPGRADVICAGALILEAAMDRLGATTCTVSDRGVRWGLLARRFGGA